MVTFKTGVNGLVNETDTKENVRNPYKFQNFPMFLNKFDDLRHFNVTLASTHKIYIFTLQK